MFAMGGDANGLLIAFADMVLLYCCTVIVCRIVYAWECQNAPAVPHTVCIIMFGAYFGWSVSAVI